MNNIKTVIENCNSLSEALATFSKEVQTAADELQAMMNSVLSTPTISVDAPAVTPVVEPPARPVLDAVIADAGPETLPVMHDGEQPAGDPWQEPVQQDPPPADLPVEDEAAAKRSAAAKKAAATRKANKEKKEAAAAADAAAAEAEADTVDTAPPATNGATEPVANPDDWTMDKVSRMAVKYATDVVGDLQAAKAELAEVAGQGRVSLLNADQVIVAGDWLAGKLLAAGISIKEV